MKTRANAYMRVVEWDDEDKIFIGSAPPLIGRCCHGKSRQAVLKELDVIVDEWIEILDKEGMPLPKAKQKYNGKILARVSPEVHRALSIRAMQERRSLNSFVEAALEVACMAQPSPKKRRKATA